MRLKETHGSWRDPVCIGTALCQHAPPRLAVLLSDPALALATSEEGRAAELERFLWRVAMEVHEAGFMRDMGNAARSTFLRKSTELSGRQWEIATRLVGGQSVPEIARGRYLSQSTVRYHRTVAYRT